MARAKKPAEVKYGIEITKPHSQEMYDHNDMVAAEIKKNIIQLKWGDLMFLLLKSILHEVFKLLLLISKIIIYLLILYMQLRILKLMNM